MVEKTQSQTNGNYPYHLTGDNADAIDPENNANARSDAFRAAERFLKERVIPTLEGFQLELVRQHTILDYGTICRSVGDEAVPGIYVRLVSFEPDKISEYKKIGEKVYLFSNGNGVGLNPNDTFEENVQVAISAIINFLRESYNNALPVRVKH